MPTIECFANVDSLFMGLLLLGLAAGIIIGAVIVDSIHKSRKESP